MGFPNHRANLGKGHRRFRPLRAAGILAQRVALSTGKKNDLRKTVRSTAKRLQDWGELAQRKSLKLRRSGRGGGLGLGSRAVLRFIPAHGDEFADAALLHWHSVEHRRHTHRAWVVRDDNNRSLRATRTAH